MSKRSGFLSAAAIVACSTAPSELSQLSVPPPKSVCICQVFTAQRFESRAKPSRLTADRARNR